MKEKLQKVLTVTKTKVIDPVKNSLKKIGGGKF